MATLAELKKKKAEMEAVLAAQQAELLSKKEETDRLWRQEYAHKLPPQTDFITDVSSRPKTEDQIALDASRAELFELIGAEGETGKTLETLKPPFAVVRADSPDFNLRNRQLREGKWDAAEFDDITELGDTPTPFKSGLTFLDDIEDVSDVTAVSDAEVFEDSTEDIEEGNSFDSRMVSARQALGQMSPYPTTAYADPRILANREKLQKRRNILRAIYGKGPKDIVWGSGSGSGTSSTLKQQRDHWKLLEQRRLETAYAMTMPQTRNDVIDLSRELQLPLEKLLDLHGKARPDLAYNKLDLEMQNLEGTRNQKNAAAIAISRCINEDGSYDEECMTKHKVHALKQGYGGDTYNKYITDSQTIVAAAAPNFVTYSIPWRVEPKNKWIYEALGKEFQESSPDTKINNGRAFLRLRPTQTATSYSFNLNDPKNKALLNRISGLNLPGFQEYTPTVNRHIFTDPGGAVVPGSGWDPANQALVMYADDMKRLGYGSMRSAEASEQALQNKAARQTAEYGMLAKKKNQANAVLELATHMKALPEGTFGGANDFRLTIENVGELVGDWSNLILPAVGRALGVDLMAPTEENINNNLYKLTADNLAAFKDQAAMQQDPETRVLMEAEYKLFESQLKRDRKDLATKDGATRARITARLMSAALATLVARLYSTNDRLLKDQYMTFKKQTDLQSAWKSAMFSRHTLDVILTMASKRMNYIQGELASMPQPSAYRISSESGMMHQPSLTGLPSVLEQMDEWKRNNPQAYGN
jgi:hypothetical protein